MWQALGFYDGEHREEISPALFTAPPARFPIRHPPYPKSLILRHELHTLGFLLSLHPLERYQSILKNMGYVRASTSMPMWGNG
jgi:hypothetical protein